MTLIHQCDACGYQGRVVELSDSYLCEDCFYLYEAQKRAEVACPECGRQGVTEAGICYPCENTPDAAPISWPAE